MCKVAYFGIFYGNWMRSNAFCMYMLIDSYHSQSSSTSDKAEFGRIRPNSAEICAYIAPMCFAYNLNIPGSWLPSFSVCYSSSRQVQYYIIYQNNFYTGLSELPYELCGILQNSEFWSFRSCSTWWWMNDLATSKHTIFEMAFFVISYNNWMRSNTFCIYDDCQLSF